MSLYSSCSHEDSIDGGQRGHQVLHLWRWRHPLLREQCILGVKRRGNSEHAGSRSCRGEGVICGGNNWNVKIALQHIYMSNIWWISVLINVNPTCSRFGLSEIRSCCFSPRLVQDVERIVDFRVRWRERAQAADGADDGHVLVNQWCHALAVQVSAVAVVTWKRRKVWQWVPVF